MVGNQYSEKSNSEYKNLSDSSKTHTYTVTEYLLTKPQDERVDVWETQMVWTGGNAHRLSIHAEEEKLNSSEVVIQVQTALII